jgi:hypothetical protein
MISGVKYRGERAMLNPQKNDPRDIFPPLLGVSRKRIYGRLPLQLAYPITPHPRCQEIFSLMKVIFISSKDGPSFLVAG